MPSPAAKFRLLATAVLVLTACAAVALARWALLPWAVGAALRQGGATDVSFAVARATPWRLQVDDLAFNFDAVRVAGGRASLVRSHWWLPSLGTLRVETAQVAVDLDKLAAAKAPAVTAAPAAATPAARIPLEAFSLDGRVTLQAGGLPDQTLAVDFSACATGPETWQGEAHATAPGLDLALAATYQTRDRSVDFRANQVRLDVEAWQRWLEHWAPLPVEPWTLAGVVTATAEGRYDERGLTLRGNLGVHHARVANANLGLVAEGIDFEAKAVDFTRQQVGEASLRVRTLTSGKLAASDLAATLAVGEGERVEVKSFTARTLGGTVAVEPFVYQLGALGVDVVVKADGIRAEQVMALTQDLPARATGSLSGRLPLHWEPSGLRLGTGWLGLVAGDSAEIEFHANGLLTAGAPANTPSYAVLKKIEDGILKLKVTELRLDVRPPDSPANRTARLHVVGAPVDPTVKAPVTLDLNVNGPIESLLNLGMKGGISLGTKP